VVDCVACNTFLVYPLGAATLADWPLPSFVTSEFRSPLAQLHGRSKAENADFIFGLSYAILRQAHDWTITSCPSFHPWRVPTANQVLLPSRASKVTRAARSTESSHGREPRGFESLLQLGQPGGNVTTTPVDKQWRIFELYNVGTMLGQTSRNLIRKAQDRTNDAWVVLKTSCGDGALGALACYTALMKRSELQQSPTSAVGVTSPAALPGHATTTASLGNQNQSLDLTELTQDAVSIASIQASSLPEIALRPTLSICPTFTLRPCFDTAGVKLLLRISASCISFTWCSLCCVVLKLHHVQAVPRQTILRT